MNSVANLFYLIILLFTFGSMAVVFFYSNITVSSLDGWQAFISDLMIIYLIFVIFRSVILIILSFAEYYFRKDLKEPEIFPLVTIIVPCFNEETTIAKVINSIADQDYPNFEILIIDDGSKDNTFISAKKHEIKNKIRVITQENQGKSGALNRGISEAAGDYVLCVDADSLLAPNVLRLAMAYFEKNQNLSAVAGCVIVGNTRNILTSFQRLEYVIGLNFHKTAQAFLQIVTIVPGPIGVFKKQTLLDIGGYQSHTFAEDCDLTIRLLTAGYDITYCPDMYALTEAPEDFQSLISQRYRWSRGVTQAILSNSNWLLKPHKNFRNFSIVLYMFTESIIIPLINFFFFFITFQQALYYGTQSILGPFYVSLTILDLVLAFYCVATEKQNLILIMLAIINRVTYGLALEVIRFFSLVDELFRIPMNWGKLIRKGL